MKMWIGKEKEGKNIGRKTLFVEGIQKDEDIERYLKKVKAVYFGAGNSLDFDIRQIKKFAKKIKVIVETDVLPPEKIKNVEWILRVSWNNMPDYIKRIKLGFVEVYSLSKPIKNRKPFGKLYKGDKVV